MKIAQKSILRIKEMIKKDREKLPDSFLNMVKNDIYNAVNSYFDVEIENVKIDYVVDNDGNYQIQLQIISKGIKKIGFINHI